MRRLARREAGRATRERLRERVVYPSGVWGPTATQGLGSPEPQHASLLAGWLPCDSTGPKGFVKREAR